MGEILVRLGDDEAEVDGGKRVREGVLHALPEATPVVSLIILRETAGRDSLAVLGHGSLFFGDEVCTGGVGEVGDEPEVDQGDNDTDDS
jgi:hypothetical protein